jgi:hypothetical protein
MEIENPAAGSRKKCPYCDEDISAEAKKCKHCGEFLDAELREASRPPVPAPTPKWSPGTAALLSLIIPGAGQMYKGQVISGLFLLFCTAIGYLLFIIPGLFIHFICIVGAASGDPTK